MRHLEPDDELLTVEQTAKLLHVRTNTVYNWIWSGALEVISLPSSGKKRTGGYRIRRSTLDSWISED